MSKGCVHSTITKFMPQKLPKDTENQFTRSFTDEESIFTMKELLLLYFDMFINKPNPSSGEFHARHYFFGKFLYFSFLPELIL